MSRWVLFGLSVEGWDIDKRAAVSMWISIDLIHAARQ